LVFSSLYFVKVTTKHQVQSTKIQDQKLKAKNLFRMRILYLTGGAGRMYCG